MVPIFIFVTLFATGEKIDVNMQHVCRIYEIKENDGCVLYFNDGKKLMIREKMADVDQAIFRSSVRFLMECQKIQAEDTAL